jgi:K+ transporter
VQQVTSLSTIGPTQRGGPTITGLDVVSGDIGTTPLCAFQTVFTDVVRI